MPLELPPIVGQGAQAGGAGMDNLTRILELKSRQDTLQLTRQQLEQRQKEMQFEETGRQFTAARTVLENTQPGSPHWRSAANVFIKGYGGNPESINVPEADVHKALTNAINKIHAMGDEYARGKRTKDSLREEATNTAVATLMGLNAYAQPLDDKSGLGRAADMLTDAAKGGEKVIVSGQQEDIATAGHAARTAATKQAQLDVEEQRFQHAKEKYDYGIGKGGGAAGKTPEEKAAVLRDKVFFESLSALPKTEKRVVGKGMNDTDLIGTVARPWSDADIQNAARLATNAVEKFFPSDAAKAGKVGREAGSLIKGGMQPELATIGAALEEVGADKTLALPEVKIGADGSIDNFNEIVDTAGARADFLDQLAQNNFPTALAARKDIGGTMARLLEQAGVPKEQIPAILRLIVEKGAPGNATGAK